MAAADRKRRVLLIVRWPLGGIRTFLRYVYRGFDPDRWEFTIVAPDHPELAVLLAEDLGHLRMKHISVGTDPGGLEFLLQTTRVLAGSRFDFVHSHGFTAGLSTALPVRLLGRYHLLTSHDVINGDQFVGTRGRFVQALTGQLFGLFDRIHSVSHDAQANLLEHFPSLDRDRCLVIPNGIEVERFLEAEPRDFRGELGLGQDVFLIGFMGRFMAQKGFRYLLDAMEILVGRTDLPRRPLVIAFGEGGFLTSEKRAIAARGLDDHFLFLPFTANAAASLKGFDVAAMPSLWEACGLLAMESLVAATPLVCTSCVGLREVVRDTPAVVVPPRDGAALAEALADRILRDERSLFRDFARTAAARYDVRAQVEGIRRLYDTILAATGRSGDA